MSDRPEKQLDSEAGEMELSAQRSSAGGGGDGGDGVWGSLTTVVALGDLAVLISLPRSSLTPAEVAEAGVLTWMEA